MRVFYSISCFALSLLALPLVAADYPERTVRLVVPFAPGGATDIVARVLAQKLTEAWGQTVVVDNRAGASGNIGAELVAKSAPDGYTLLMPSGSVLTANPHIYRKLSFDPAKDFAPITNIASGPQVVAVANSVAAKSVAELVNLAKSRQLNFGSAGIGSQVHLAAENFLYRAGVNAVHVPYKGEGPALADLAGGQIELLTPNLAAAVGFVSAGKIRAIAVTSRQRAAQLPEVPAVAETLPGFESLGWFGLVAPAGTADATVRRIFGDSVKVLRSEDIRRQFDQLGMVPVGNGSAEFAAAIKEESSRWRQVIQARGLAVD